MNKKSEITPTQGNLALVPVNTAVTVGPPPSPTTMLPSSQVDSFGPWLLEFS